MQLFILLLLHCYYFIYLYSHYFCIKIDYLLLIWLALPISKGALDVKVQEVETDEEFKQLNQNFNEMIEKLKEQQDKLLITERYEAWESVARKLAHEIKILNTYPIINRQLREKYKDKLSSSQRLRKYSETINRQIKDIEKLVNEFSNFARMPRPILKKIDIVKLINKSLDFIKLTKGSVNLIKKSKKIYQRWWRSTKYVFINLIKNSEGLLDKLQKNPSFKGNIDIEIDDNNDYIVIRITDNGTGITDARKAMTPYFTTKKTGTGLGLPIVTKIVNEHSGNLTIKNKKDKNGVIVSITLPKYA